VIAVAGTPFDFTQAKPLGADINADNKSLKEMGGYDHNFCLEGWEELLSSDISRMQALREVACLSSEKSGISMSCITDQPGIQVYTACMMPEFIDKRGVKRGKHGAVCLETQHFPNSAAIKDFPSIVLKEGQAYETTTKYVFTAE